MDIDLKARLRRALRQGRAWILAEPPTGTASAADIQLSALRVVLLACIVLASGIGLHSAMMAWLVGKPWVIGLVAVILLLLGAAISQARRGGKAGPILLLASVYAAGLSITISTGTQPELSRLGYVLSYVTPLVAGLLLNWRVALALMLANGLFFLMAVGDYQAPQLPQQQIRLPNSVFYVHAALFMFFNLCLPLAVFRMVDGMRKTQQQLRNSRELSEQVFQAASAPTLVCGPDGEVLRANTPFLALCNLSDEQQLRGRAIAALFAAPAGEPARAWRPETGQRWRLTIGDAEGLEVQLRSVRTIGARLRAYGFEDVTALRRVQADLAESVRREAWATWHDTLTGLPNRLRCIQALDILCQDGPQAPPFALLILRIGNLRQLNARYGVSACDELLQRFVQGLLACLPAQAQAARVRGSVIALWLPCSADETQMLAEMRALHATLPRQQLLGGRQAVELDLAFGLVSAADLLARNDGGASAAAAVGGAELLRCSELALDMGQDPRWREAFDGLVLFNAATAQAVARSMAIEAELPQALSGAQLHLLYQPKLRPDGSLLGFEALARWNSPALGAVSPVDFIPVAESCGLVGALTDWVVEEACHQLARWRGEGLAAAHCRVAVNLSARDLERANLFETLQASMARHGVTAAQLELEVTESALARQPSQALLQLQRLHEAGFRIAIDDFGTGYSSLAKLVDLPIDVLKIDRSFLHQLPGDARRERVVRSVVSLAHSLRLQVVAEGVETAQQMRFLEALGVQGLQGFFFGRPERPAHWQTLLRHGHLPAEKALAQGGLAV